MCKKEKKNRRKMDSFPDDFDSEHVGQRLAASLEQQRQADLTYRNMRQYCYNLIIGAIDKTMRGVSITMLPQFHTSARYKVTSELVGKFPGAVFARINSSLADVDEYRCAGPAGAANNEIAIVFDQAWLENQAGRTAIRSDEMGAICHSTFTL